MASVIQSNFRIRKHLGRVRKVIEVPNLIDIQKTSYDKFLQSTVPQNERLEVGLQAVFRSVFPIKDFNGTSALVFVSYNLEKPKYDVEECRQRGMTYAAPIKVTTQRYVTPNGRDINKKGIQPNVIVPMDPRLVGIPARDVQLHAALTNIKKQLALAH